MKVVIIGGVAGGATAAARLRRLDERAEIVIIERTGYVSYANCGLPYYVGGTITDRRKLTLQTPESFRSRFRIDVRVNQEATRIDREAKTITVHRLDTDETYTESYDKLILSPGAHATIPSTPGIDGERVFTLRTVEDTFRIHDFVMSKHPRSAIVVGAGFIGLEMAENLCDRGLDVTVVQRSGHVMPTLDEDMAAIAHNHIRSHGVHLLLNTQVERIDHEDNSVRARLVGGKELTADMLILSIGVTPESTLARDAGLELGIRGSIRVDEHMLTSDPAIYAVGDAVQVKHYVTGNDALIALAGPANKQGRIAADNICGIASAFTGSQGSSVLKLFDLTIATTGLTRRSAKMAGIDAEHVILSPASHATYYPGFGNMTMKVVYEPATGRILGAQIIGTDGVDKRVDVVATAIHANMTAADLAELDLAYAPPYSSAKDPVNMAGFMIENIREGRVDQLTWEEALALHAAGNGGAQKNAAAPNDITAEAAESAAADIAKHAGTVLPTVFLDTRTTYEFNAGHISHALHIPLDDLRDRLDELPRNTRLLTYCQSGLRSYVACRILMQHGFACTNIAGGYGFYQETLLDQETRRVGVADCGVALES